MILICAGGGASLRASEWVSNGPFGGATGTVVVSPSDPARLYTTGARGLYRSTDGGATWHLLDGFGERLVAALVVEFGDPPSMFVATASDGIFESSDGGVSWTPASTGLGLWFSARDMVADPSGSRVLYVGGETYHSAPLYRSLDRGATWVPAGNGLAERVDYLATTAAEPRLVLAGALTKSVFETTDGGASWTPLERVPGGSSMTDLVIDPTDSSVIFASAYDGVFRSLDRGANWKRVAEMRAVHALAILPDSPSTVFAATASGVFRSADGGASWQPFDDGLTDLRAWTLAVAGDDLYLAGAHGVFEAPTGATPWVARNEGLHNSSVRVIALDPVSPSTVYSVTHSSVFKSVDAGLSWQRTSFASPSGLTAFTIDPVNPQTLYAGTFADRLYKSADGGATWVPSGEGLPKSLLGDVLVDPADPAVVYVGHVPVSQGDPGPPTLPGVYKSLDGGASWSYASTGMGGTRAIDDLAFDPRSSSTLYAVGTFSSAVRKSTDGAATWFVSGSLPSISPSTLVIDPTTPTTVYAAGDSYLPPSIFKSLDSGQSWFSIHGDLPTEGIHELVLDPEDPRTLWAATEHGLFRNRDSGPIWEPFNEGRPYDEIRAMAYRASTQTLYVGTRGGGVYQMSLALLIDGFESGDTTAWSASTPP
ncbi:MAG: hypothetical protein MI919_27835 [Holophagales bacterium]|nr:hypothetical protein [Holophagales bacterium]